MPAALEQFAAAALTAGGMSAPDAAGTAAALVDADLQGYASHGTSRLKAYITMVAAGAINPRPDIRLVSDAPAVAVLDGDNGPGQPLGLRAMDLAVERARRYGVGLVAVRRGGHLGALGYIARRALDQGLIGLVASNGSSVVVPQGGAAPTVSNSPVAVALPGPGQVPVVLDLAFSAVARGKVTMAMRKGEEIPPGWAVDRDGNPTQDPAAALAGGLLPAAGYKGYALAAVIELLCIGLSGAGPLDPPGNMYPSPITGPLHYSHLVGALQIDAFLPPDEFQAGVAAAGSRIQSSPPGPGSDGVRLPGQRAFALADQRRHEGVAVPAEAWAEFGELAARFDLTLPPVQ